MSRALSRSQLQRVVKAITKYYPPSYADSSWDNTGLLIDCSVDQTSTNVEPKVLLTVDLTASVVQEAVDKHCNAILAYHPFIFPSWKNLNPHKNPQHKSAIRLIQEGISVYCPHTAVDAAKDGVNDWLVYGVAGRDWYGVVSNVVIEPIKGNCINGEEPSEVGYGRLVTLATPLTLQQIVDNIKKALGIDYVQVASPNENFDKHIIRRIALCAGSGSGVFKSLHEEVDLYYTGELSHHEILRYRESGKAVIVCNHSNTERGFLKEEMSKRLSKQGIRNVVSEMDADPLRVV
ncbi:NIF3 (YGL221C) [Zygosaccharomyces parabailii]|nr:NIF3 (YGL221C) [Zygosaccharomyces parabailii]CDH11849.1 probable NGG1-interacting factor 3 [Zygosaccharomyces bailii ISA1307]